jgi:hypothetical protein
MWVDAAGRNRTGRRKTWDDSVCEVSPGIAAKKITHAVLFAEGLPRERKRPAAATCVVSKIPPSTMRSSRGVKLELKESEISGQPRMARS